MAKDNADLNVEKNRDFYPEDAQERNFAEARRLAVENHEADVERTGIADTETKRKSSEGHTEIPARPEVSADKNPEQVKTNEDGDSSVKGEELDTVAAREKNFEEARKDAVEADKEQDTKLKEAK